MPDDIDEISVKMSLTTEDFVKDVDKAIEAAVRRAEDFENRVAELHNALKQLSEGAEVVFSAAATGESLDAVAERLIRTGEIADRTVEQLVAEAEAASTLLDEISQQTLDNFMEMADAAGVLISEDAQEGLLEYTKLMALGAENAEAFVDQMNQATPAMLEAAKVAQPANIAYEKVIASLEKLGIVVPFDELEAFKNELLDEAAAADAAGVSNEELGQRMDGLSQKFLDAKQGVGEAGGFISEFKENLGGLLRGLAPVAIAIAAVTKAYQALSQFVKESIQVALQAAESQRLLAAAVREHARAVGELSPTLAEANEFADQLGETYSRTRSEMRSLVTDALLMTSDLKLAKDQTEGLANAAVVMSEALGVDATSALRIFTNFLNTGYTTGLQRLGFSLDEQSLGVEAVRRGYIGLGDELDEQTMRMLGLELINERASDLSTDIADGLESVDQRAEDVNRRLEDQKELLGEFLIPAWIAFKEAMADVTEFLVGGFIRGMVAGQQTIMVFGAQLTALDKTLGRMGEIFTKKGFNFAEVYGEELSNQLTRMVAKFDEDVAAAARRAGVFDKFELDEYEPRPKGYDPKAAIESQLIADGLLLVDKAATRAAYSLSQYEDAVIGAAREATPELERAAQRLAESLARVDDRLEQTLLNIERSFGDRRLTLQINLAKNIAAINRQAAEARLTRTIDFNKREEREEQDHILRMKRLEEDYLVNLDDAVRERDALAVLQLQRQHNIDKKRATEDAGKAKRRRKEDFELELAEIERQRQIKISLAIAEFKERMAMLAEEQRLREERAREDAAKQKKLLEKQMADKMRIIIQGLVSELNLTDDQLKQLFRLMDSYYGADGWFVRLVSNYYRWLGQQRASHPLITAENAPQPRSGRTQAQEGRSFQRGGSFIATSPQFIEVGESSPERVTITPLSGATGQPRGSGMGGDRVEVEVAIGLDDGLVGEIVDQTANEMANVIVSINRGGRKT